MKDPLRKVLRRRLQSQPFAYIMFRSLVEAEGRSGSLEVISLLLHSKSDALDSLWASLSLLLQRFFMVIFFLLEHTFSQFSLRPLYQVLQLLSFAHQHQLNLDSTHSPCNNFRQFLADHHPPHLQQQAILEPLFGCITFSKNYKFSIQIGQIHFNKNFVFVKCNKMPIFYMLSKIYQIHFRKLINKICNTIKLMTFFGQEKKNLLGLLKPTQKLGPGAYSPEKSSSEKQSYAPFGSLIKKHNAVKNNTKQPIGPGSYNISGDILKPNVIQYQNENCIIIKINQQGSSQFKSKKQRFHKKLLEQTPGPGAYHHLSEQNICKKRTRSVGNSFYKMKELYANQYKSRRKPTLLSDKPEVPEEQTKPKQIVKGVVKWELNKKQRFQTQPKQYFNEQDKAILLDKAVAEKKRNKMGNKQSSFFASKSVKSCFDQIIYKSSNPFKVQIRKMLGYEDQAPGPGSYDIVVQKNTQMHKPANLQFFGSTVDRFQNTQGQPKVGPGDYDISQTRIEAPNSKPKKIQRMHRKTFSEPDEQNRIGPGYYRYQQDSTSKPSFNMRMNHGVAQFGSHQPRFTNQKQQQKQKKSQCLSFIAQEDQERKKRIEQQFNMRRNTLKNKKYSVFASQSKRNCFAEKQPIKNNPFGMYEVGVEDIGTRIKKKQQLMQQFEQCNLTKPGFLSAVERFKTEKQQQPGHKDCWCQIKQVQKKNIEHMSPAFQSNSKRTQVFESKNIAPAVGSYSKNSSLITNSFNSRFIKQNENKSKKIKMWKTKL